MEVDGAAATQHVLIVTPLGTTISVPCTGGGIDIAELKEYLAQRGFSPSVQSLHVHQGDSAHRGQAGDTRECSLRTLSLNEAP